MTEMPDEFKNMSRVEQRAFIAWFSSPMSRLIKYDESDRVCMGKLECERVPFQEFWLEKMPALGWITATEMRRLREATEYELKATDLGFEVREAYLDFRKKRWEADDYCS